MNYEPQNSMIMEDQNTPDINSDSFDQPNPQANVALTTTNIAESLEEERLRKIGADCKRGFEQDKESRRNWDNDADEWLRLASQTREPKSFPWPKASNIKYPLVSTAAMQFSARAYPTLIPSNGAVVHAIPVGKDLDGKKEEMADRVSTYMSYQLLYDMDGWEEDMDKLLIMLAIVGTVFKKTYYDKGKDKICSYLISPKNLVVNYWAQDIDCCERVSEIIEMSPRLIKEKQLQGIYLDVDLGDPVMPTRNQEHSEHQPPELDETTPHTIIEQHTFLDLDKDGYAEPYVVTFDLASGEVLRIEARFFQEDVQHDGKKIVKIKPRTHYTKYSFIPNPDGSFYSIGFGMLLGPLNESVNTIINQLVDSGTINNLQSGFIGKGLRIKMGDSRLQPGEWRPVNATSDDLRKQIVPLPAKEPSNVLFQLMGSLITSGKELASVAEIFVGKMPGQNTPATTTMASIEQGMKVFTAVYKRVYRSLSQEIAKVFELNSLFLDPNKYIEVLDMTVDPHDFDLSQISIEPGADPTAVSQTEKLIKAQGLMELMQQAGPLLNPVEILSRVLQAQEQPNWQALLAPQVAQTGQPPEPPPDPKVMAVQMKAQAEQQKIQLQAQAQDHEQQLKERDAQTQLAMKAQEMEFKRQSVQQELAAKAQIHQQDANIKTAQMQQQLVHANQQHAQSMTHQAEQHKSKLQQQKAISKSGSRTTSQKNSSKK